MTSELPAMEVVRLGRVEYADGLAMQAAFEAAVVAGAAPDTLLLLEHDSVITLGRGAKAKNILFTEAELAARGVAVHETGRGGDVTWHGPGQIVGYPIVNLARTPATKDVRKFVRSLEEILIRVCADDRITGERDPENAGVWVSGTEKIGAIGVRIAKWVTSHGFALNVSPDLSQFDLILPCGIPGRGVTSLQRLGSGASLDEVQTRIVSHASAVFTRDVVTRDVDQTTIAVAIRRKLHPERAKRVEGLLEIRKPFDSAAGLAIAQGEGGSEFLVLRRVPARGGFRQIVTGRIEPGETPGEAAARELREETGLDENAGVRVRPLGYEHAFSLATPSRSGRPILGREIVFLADVPAGADAVLSDEHDEMAWLPLDEARSAVKHTGHRRALGLAAAAAFK